jgi:hypothetical protein
MAQGGMTHCQKNLCVVIFGQQEIEPSCCPNRNHDLTMIEADPNYVYSPASGKMILSPGAKKERARLRTAQWRAKLKEQDPEAWAEAKRKIREWHKANKERVREINRKSSLKPSCRAKKKAYRTKMRDKFKAYQKSYLERHPERRKASMDRYNKTPKARVAAAVRSRLRRALVSKTEPSRACLGCTAEFFKKYLESQFLPGMTWDNFGKWHMDHIVPLSAFDLTDPNQMRVACNWTNIRPLWAKANLRKSSKLTHPQMSLPLIAQ